MMKRATFIGMGIGSSLILFTRCGLGANPVLRENSTSSLHVNGPKNQVYSSINSASGDNPVTGSGMLMKSIDMKSTHVGWAVTTTGIMRTNDGGVYWKHVLALPNGGDIRTDFMSASEAVIAIDTPSSSAPAGLFITSDGGNHWTQRVLPTTGVTNLSFIRPSGWIMSDPSGLSMGSEPVLLLRTQDDGANWVKIAVSTSLPSPHTMPDSGVKNSMLFTSSNVGFVSVGGPDARLYRTSDSGLHWDRVNLPKMHVSSGLAGTVSEPVFFNPSHGIISSFYTDYHHDWLGTYATADGGRTWELESCVTASSSPSGWPDGFCFINPRDWKWVMGNVLWETSNAGHTWNTITLPFSHVLNLDFVNNNEGWAVVRGGGPTRLFFTQDGGTS